MRAADHGFSIGVRNGLRSQPRVTPSDPLLWGVDICSRNSYPSVGMKRKLGPKGQVVIPKDIRDKFSLTEGAILDFEVQDDAIVVKPEPSPEEFVERFLSVKGKKLRKRVDWKSVLDDEYKVTGR